ncbi:hypothetical protein [Caulobacter sp. 17J65-9]|uniref:hypothetical protein n=1 Tax=Caulobacter sp. 17J65-9 TaxID=2709382 RepID=UPI0013CB42B7|nr:hypothetical protein [Caulobacter sp. 17J65-9]NEX94860.1 hypothetical protein [Caulobacter sp. 17J65-9]
MVAAALLAAGCTRADPPQAEAEAEAAASAWRSGVYSDVSLHEETGDLLGMEIELHVGPRPSVVVATCEGQCYGGKTWPATITDREIRFTVQDSWDDQDGKPVPGDPIHYVGRLEGDVVVLTSPDLADLDERLARMEAPAPGRTVRLACGDVACG